MIHWDDDRLIDLARLLGADAGPAMEHLTTCGECRATLQVMGLSRDALRTKESAPADTFTPLQASGAFARRRQPSAWVPGIISAGSALIVGFFLALQGFAGAPWDGPVLIPALATAALAALVPLLQSRPLKPAVGVLLLLTVACSPEPTPKVLVIGIDGVRPDVLAEVDTPHLDRLAEEGVLIRNARTGFPSVSGPGWSSFLNGVWPAKHGVTSNDFTGERYDQFPDFLTRIEQVRPTLSTFAVADWEPLMRLDSGVPPISDAIDVKHVLDGYDLGWSAADDSSTALAIRALRNGDPDALFVYLGAPDEISHTTESIGAEYRAAISAADGQVGRLIAAVRARPTAAREDWLILSSTDHGRLADGDHGGDSPEERTIYFLASGPSVRSQAVPDSVFIVDVAVTALTHLGIPLDPAWQLDGRPVGLPEM